MQGKEPSEGGPQEKIYCGGCANDPQLDGRRNDRERSGGAIPNLPTGDWKVSQ